MKREDKKALMDKFAVHPRDTGSPQVQVAILTERIKALSKHLTENPKDNHSRRGLLKMVGQRRKTLKYLEQNSPEVYKQLTTSLELK